MSKAMIRRLGVNIDHVATIRQARRSPYPDPVAAAICAELAGADQITCHIRGDRRHIQDEDIYRIKNLNQQFFLLLLINLHPSTPKIHFLKDQ